MSVGVVICLAGGTAAWAALRPDTPSYRLASAEKADVTQTASLAGTVASATRSDRAFQVSGTVSGVDVKVGDKVTAGQTLATLDASTLNDEVTQSQQAVTTAQQKLNDDLASQTSSASTSTSSTADAAAATDAPDDALATATFVAAATPTKSSANSTIAADVKAVQAAQAALIDLYTGTSGVDAVTNDVKAQLTAVQATLTGLGDSNGACAVFTALPAGTDQATADTDLTACQDAVTAALSSTDAGDTSTSVAEALTQLGTELSALNELQTKITAAESALDNAVTKLQNDADAAGQSSGSSPSSPSTPTKPSAGGSGSSSGGSGTSGAPSRSGSAPSEGSTGSGSGNGTGTGTGSRSGNGSGSSSGGSTGTKTTQVATAEDIVSDQASLASAQANLAVAQQNVGLATLTTPIAGTVAAVGISAGSSVSAGSTSEVISVIGDDGWVIDTSATASAIGPLKVGQTADVTVSGVSGTQHAKVSSIGFLNTATDSSTPSYDVTLSITDPASGLLNGASARTTVDVDTARDVLTVPSSAVHLGTGNSYTVDVLADGKETSRTVKVGAVGSDRVQITSGLSAGDQVVLADLSSTVSSDSSSTSSTGGGLGGLGGGTRVPGTGGGFGGGGFGGGNFQPRQGG
ncbi:hypothetical protein GCM10022287_38360 [Gryllotalpicola koreensis]|uniref:HlyD family efflux transporter periplasmic adaptor subunit n=1 Tax=Gryllotalpicola koreensis TaxID=993086 RepID=A0ABP8ADN1_9MICO